MKVKIYTTPHSTKNQKISFIPDIGYYNGMGTIYISWIGVTIHLKFKK